MCRCNYETVDHLLLHCPVVGNLWSWIFGALGFFGCSGNLLFSWWNKLGRHSLDIWNLVQLRCTFENVSSSNSQLLDCFTFTLFDWSRAWGFTSSSNVVDFISSLSSYHDDVTPWSSSVHALCTLCSISFINISIVTYQKKIIFCLSGHHVLSIKMIYFLKRQTIPNKK